MQWPLAVGSLSLCSPPGLRLTPPIAADRREVPLVLHAFVPEARAADVDHFESMVNAAGATGPVSCEGLAADIAACTDAATAARASPAPELDA